MILLKRFKIFIILNNESICFMSINQLLEICIYVKHFGFSKAFFFT